MLPIHPNYKYNCIPIISTNADELDFNSNYLLNNFDIDTKSVKPDLLYYIEDNDGGYIRLYRNNDSRLCYSIGKLTELEHWSKQYGYTYERPFYINDLKMGVIQNIMIKGTSTVEPSYKSKGKIERTIESNDIKLINEHLSIHPDYKFNSIIIKIDSEDEIDKLNLYLGGIIDVESVSDSIDNYFNNGEIPYIRIRSEESDRLTCSAGPMDRLEKLSKDLGFIYEKVFTVNDVKNGTIKSIINNGYVTPSYKPKGKIVRESLSNYEKVLILVKDSEESKIIQEKLFEYGCKWAYQSIGRYQEKEYPCVLAIYLYDKSIKYSAEPWFIQTAREGNYAGAYSRLFDINSLDECIRFIINKGIIVPSYKPKGKIVRESSDTYGYGAINILARNNREVIEVQNFLFSMNFSWWDGKNIKFGNNNELVFLADLSDDTIYQSGNLQNFMDVKDNTDREYKTDGKIYTLDDRYKLKCFLKNEPLKPSYEPKRKITRENTINEEVADNIQLEDGDVLNYYDDDAYAFMFLNDYRQNIFLIEQGMRHMDMIGNYLYKIKDKDYMDVYNSYDHNNFLLDIIDNSEYKGRLWVEHKIISFWDLSCNEQDKLALKDILERLEKKFKIKIEYNQWKIEFFDIEKQKLYFITLEQYFKNKLEDEGTNMSTSYHEYLKKLHLDSSHKKPVPYGYGSKNPKYKPLEYRQILYQESFNMKIFNELPYNTYVFRCGEKDNRYDIERDLTEMGVDVSIRTDFDNEYLFFTSDVTNGHRLMKLYGCNYDYITGESVSYRNKIKATPRFDNFRDLQDFLKKKTVPNYKPKGKVQRTLGINENIKILDYNIPDTSKVLLPDEQRKIFKEGDVVLVRPDAYDYFTNVASDMNRVLGKEIVIKNVYKMTEIYGSVTASISVIGEDYVLDFNEDDLIVYGSLYGYTEEDDWYWYYRCLHSKKLDVPNYKPKGKVERTLGINENIITEDCDYVELPNGEKIDFKDKDAYPFLYIDGVDLMIGKPGTIHTEMLTDYYTEINRYSDENLKEQYFNKSKFKGRLWLDHKVISFWEFISSFDLKKVVNDINKLLGIKIDETWLIDYYESPNFKIGDKKELMSVKEYIDSNFSKYQKSTSIGYGSKSSKYKPLEWRQTLYQESNNNLENSEIITKFDKFNSVDMNNNSNNIVMERIHSRMELPKDIYDFNKLFKKSNRKLYIVGGAVRDFIMGKKPHDFDMVTDAQPDEVVEILKDYDTDIHGAHFGVVRVYTKTEPLGYEIATYRKDISKGRDTKGADPKVEIGKHITIKDDVRRRDLTMNALFYNIDNGEIIDIVGGVRDIRNNIVKAVGEPQKRFDEDRLRILRTLRFAAVTGGKIDKETSDALKKDSRLFGISEEDDVSRERIFAEFLKVKDKTRSNNDPRILTRFINLLIDYDIMSQIFPVLVTEKDIEPTTYLTVAIAQTLRNNKIDDSFKQTLIDAKIPNNYVEIISVLIKILKNGVKDNEVYTLYREMKSKGVRTDILKDWIKVMHINDKKILALLEYEPTTTGIEVMKDGFRKAEIGEEIKRREAIKFKKLVDSLN